MSSTRHADAGSPLRQERYCSSPEYDRGLMANVVAQRCSVLVAPMDRELIYFLQYLSHERGLVQFAEEQLALHPDQIATKSMQEFGTSGHYDADQVRAIRAEMPSANFPFAFEERSARLHHDGAIALYLRSLQEGRECARPEAKKKRSSYPAEKFVACCQRAAATGLTDYLTQLCIDPKVPVDAGPWNFPNLISLLRSFRAEWQLEHAARVVSTEVSRKVQETLEYSKTMRCLTLCDGIEGLGKTHAAELWCLQRPGCARYVQVPATDDETGFYREIAKALGVSINLNSKAKELKYRIEDVLQTGDITIVFDEAAWLWGVNGTRGGLPKRMLWVMTALVNKQVPVAFVATPQEWESNKKFVSKHTRWRVGQLNGRIEHHEKLPSVLSEEELAAVVRAKLPAADAKSVTAIVDFASTSERCLGALTAVANRAKVLARNNGRTEPTRADIKAVIFEKSGTRNVPATPAPERGSSPAAPLQTPRAVTKITPLQHHGRVSTPAETKAL